MAIRFDGRSTSAEQVNSTDAPERHLSPEGFHEYLRSGAPSVIRIDGTPAVYLVIDATARQLALRTPLVRHGVPNLSGYQHISVEAIYWNDSQWCELRVSGDIILDAYPILCAIADRIQLQSLDFHTAVTEALTSLRRLLAGRGRMSEEEEIGLFGELLVLRHLLKTVPPSDAIAYWRGPDGEEHDFVLPDGDVEVKSTSLETRSHWIKDVHQLEPKVGRRLRLLSIQLTGASADGATLAGLVEEVRGLVPDAGAAEELGRKLELANWRDGSAELYTTRFRLRTKPAMFDVDNAFPAITPGRLEAAGLEGSRFRQIRYLIDLGGLGESTDTGGLLGHIDFEG
jgi:hypothetical protein